MREKIKGKWNKDLIFAGIILAAVLFSAVFFYRSGNQGSQVVVSISGREVASFPLEKDREYLIESEEGVNLLVIEDGNAYIREADCPSQVCVYTGKINLDGQVIACLPHEVIVTIKE